MAMIDLWANFFKQVHAFHMLLLALSSGSLLKNGGRREPGNIWGKSCRLLPPCSGSTNQIAEWNHMYTWHFVHSAKNCQLKNELVSVDYTPWRLVRNSFRMCGRGASPESSRSKFTVVGCGTDLLTILCSYEFTCTKCITKLNTTTDASKMRSEIVNSLCCYQV